MRGIVAAAHGRELLLPGPPGLGALFVALRRAMLRRVDHVVPVSTYTASLVRALGVDGARCTVVPNGSGLPLVPSVPDLAAMQNATGGPDAKALGGDGLLLLTVARLVERKGVGDVLEALVPLVREWPGLRYVVVGDGPERAGLEALARVLGVSANVHFTGRQSDAALAAWYGAADIFVMTPRTLSIDVEGFGLVYLEAGAAGLPVVGSRSGGIPDAIVDGETGLLVPESNPVVLAESLRTLLMRPDLRARFGQAGRERAASFTWDATADRLLSIFSTL